MKKSLLLTLVTVVTIIFSPTSIAAENPVIPISECGGVIKSGATYSISTAEEFLQFEAMNNSCSGVTIILTNDITIHDGIFSVDENQKLLYNGTFVLPEPINAIDTFGGTFDGQGHTINGLYVMGTQETGLFDNLWSNAIVKNVSIENSLFIGEGNVGSICGKDSYKNRIEKCFSNAIVIGRESVGGIAGVYESSIQSCYFNGTVISTADGTEDISFVGGIVGIGVGSIGGCANAGTVYGGKAKHVGGFAGVFQGYDISACSNTGDVYATNEASGFAGELAGKISDCFAAGNIYATKGNKFTSFVYENLVTFDGCYFIGNAEDSADYDGKLNCNGLIPIDDNSLKRHCRNTVRDTGYENHGYPIYHKIQRRKVAPSITNIEYEKSFDTRNTFTVTVEGRPAMIQFIEPTNGTRTYDRNHKNVTIKSYDSYGNEVNSLDRTAVYEVWSIYSNMMPNVEIRTRAKYLSDARYTWDSETYDFPMILANPIISMELSSTSGKKGPVPATVVADEKTEKVMFKMPDNTTVTVASKATDENGNKIFTGKAWMNKDGLNEIRVLIYRNSVWRQVGTLKYVAK